MSSQSNGLVDRRTPHSVDETVARLTDLRRAKGVTLFALIDHGGEAARVGLVMRPTKLLIFGNPRAGTALMQEAPRSAIDLPLKVLVWEDDDGNSWLTTNDAEFLRARHGLAPDAAAVLGAAAALAAAAVTAA